MVPECTCKEFGADMEGGPCIFLPRSKSYRALSPGKYKHIHKYHTKISRNSKQNSCTKSRIMLKRKANYASCYKFYHDLQVYPSLELIHFEAFRILAGYTLLFQLVLPKLLAVSKPDIHKVTKIKPKQNLWYSTLVI